MLLKVICLFVKKIYRSVTAFNYLYCSLSTQTVNPFLIGLIRTGVCCSHCFMASVLTQTVKLFKDLDVSLERKLTVSDIWINGYYKIGNIVYNYNHQSLYTTYFISKSKNVYPPKIRFLPEFWRSFICFFGACGHKSTPALGQILMP